MNDNLLLALRGTKRGRMSLWPPDRTGGQRERARRLAAQVGLPHAHDARAATLSHGEGRLLELAMALAGEPRIIMLDEPAAGLAPDAITLLLIEHDMDVALSVANIVTVMNGGTVLATGTPHEIRTSQAVHDLYREQQMLALGRACCSTRGCSSWTNHPKVLHPCSLSS